MSKRVKIDIVIGFNDVKPPPNICFVPGSKPTYYKQLLYLLHSINKNWNKDIYDYQTYAFHSRHLSEDKKQKIESLGCKVVYEPKEMQPYINRAEIFNYETDGDYTLLFDSDMILLNTPNLDFEKDIYAKPTTPQTISSSHWEYAVNKVGLEYESGKNYHFNCGCILMNNDKKKQFYKYLNDNSELLDYLHGVNRHFSIQILYSVLFHKFDVGHLDERTNVFSKVLEGKEYHPDLPIDVLHYLGSGGFNSEVKKMLLILEKEL